MDIQESLSLVRKKISDLSVENLSLKNSKEELIKENEKAIDEIFCEFLSVLDTFDKAEEAIKERGWDADENAQRSIKRLLNAKKKAEIVLERYDVKPIVFEDNKMVAEWCITNDTIPDSSKENDEIVSIEKIGYKRKGHVIRPAEVIIVKN